MNIKAKFNLPQQEYQVHEQQHQCKAVYTLFGFAELKECTSSFMLLLLSMDIETIDMNVSEKLRMVLDRIA